MSLKNRKRTALGLKLTEEIEKNVSTISFSAARLLSVLSLFYIESLPHQLPVADSVVREVPAGSDVPQQSSLSGDIVDVSLSPKSPTVKGRILSHTSQSR